MKIIQKKVSELKRADYNPRKMSGRQFEALKSSLKEDGFLQPVVFNTFKGRENIIISGHQRVDAWREMGNDTVPAIAVKVNKAREKRLNIRFNKIMGEFEENTLTANFVPEELLLAGFEQDEINDLFSLSLDTEGLLPDMTVQEPKMKLNVCPKCGHEY